MQVPITGATATTAIATAINTAIQNAGGGTNGVLPVASSVTGSVVTLTNRNGGTASDVDIRHSYQPDEALPAGVALTIAAGTVGATDPSIMDALDAIEDERYNIIAHPYGAAASMTTLETELTRRWGPVPQLDGVAFTAFRGTSAAATTYGNARNSPYSSVMGMSTSPSAVPDWSASIGGAIADSASADPALPFQTLRLRGILPAPLAARFSHAERETLPLRRHLHAHGGPRRGGGDRAADHDLPERARRCGRRRLPRHQHAVHALVSPRLVPRAVSAGSSAATSSPTTARALAPARTS